MWSLQNTIYSRMWVWEDQSKYKPPGGSLYRVEKYNISIKSGRNNRKRWIDGICVEKRNVKKKKLTYHIFAVIELPSTVTVFCRYWYDNVPVRLYWWHNFNPKEEVLTQSMPTSRTCCSVNIPSCFFGLYLISFSRNENKTTARVQSLILCTLNSTGKEEGTHSKP